jgi:hypothetical protein
MYIQKENRKGDVQQKNIKKKKEKKKHNIE